MIEFIHYYIAPSESAGRGSYIRVPQRFLEGPQTYADSHIQTDTLALNTISDFQEIMSQRVSKTAAWLGGTERQRSLIKEERMR